MARLIERNRPDRPILHVHVVPADFLGLQFFKLAATFGRFEIRLVCQIELFLGHKLIGTRPGEHDMGAGLHHAPRGTDRIARHGCSGDCTGVARLAVHDRGVEGNTAFISQHRAAPGVEVRIVFERDNSGFHGIQR